MKTIFLLVLNLIPVAHFLHAQIPEWNWAIRAGGTSNEYVYDLDVDEYGNVYAIGTFHSTSVTFGNITLSNGGAATSCDVFVVKYDNQGHVIWAKKGGGSVNDFGYGIAVDHVGNVYITLLITA